MCLGVGVYPRFSRRFSSQLSLSLCLCLLLMPSHSAPPPLDTVILDTLINHQDYGQHFFLLDTDYQVYVQPQVLEALGLKPELWQAWREQAHFPLSALAPHLSYTFDDINIRLLIEAELSAFVPQVIAVKPKPQMSAHQTVSAQPLSAFANYKLDTRSEAGTLNLSIPIEIGVKYHDWLLSSNFLYQNQPEKWVRLMSQLTWDRPKQLQRLVLGDFFPVQSLDDTAVVTGLSLRRFFTQQPQFSTLPEPRLKRWLQHPASIEWYQDDELLDTWLLKPGEVQFTDFLQGAGQGQVRLNIQDIFGHQDQYQQVFFMSQALLKPGLHDYHYQFGWRRKAFSEPHLAFGRWLLAGQHRYGVSEALSVGFSGVAQPHEQRWSPALDWVGFGRLQAHLSGDYAQRIEHDAQAIHALLQYQHQGFSVGAGGDRYSRYYNTDDESTALKQRAFISMSWPNRDHWGHFAVSIERIEYWQNPAQNILSFNYQNTLSQNLHFVLNARQKQGLNAGFELFIGLNYAFGKDWRLQLRTAQVDHQQRRSLRLSKSPQRGSSHAYRLNIEHTDDQDWKANMRWQARQPYGVLDTTLYYQPDANSTAVSWAGGMAWLPGTGLHFSRPIADSFALVSVGKPGIPIKMGEQIMGVSNAQGEVLVPELSAFYPNRLHIDLKTLPLNVALQQPEQFVKPRYRSGSFVPFELDTFTAVEGAVYFAGQPLEQVSMRLQIGDNRFHALIGKQGYFYLENIPTGTYQGQVDSDAAQCHFALKIPDSSDIVQYLGDIQCE